MERKQQILAYCLDRYVPRLPNVTAVRVMADRAFASRKPWAVAMFGNGFERACLEEYHEKYLGNHLGGYGVERLHLVQGEGSLYSTLLQRRNLRWCRERAEEGYEFEPYHWKDGDVLWRFARELGGDHRLVATRPELAREYGDKGRLRLTGAALGRTDDFAPHTVCWSLDDLEAETERMLRSYEAVRVVFDGEGASGDGASVFSTPFNREKFRQEAALWCKNRDPTAPLFVEQWFSEEDILAVSCTWRVEDGQPKFVGFNRQYEGTTSQGTKAHKGSFTSSQPAQVIPRSWQQRHGWDDERTAAVVHDIISSLRSHYLEQMAKDGWRGPACFDLILLPNGKWFISECNDRNFGSRPAADLLKQELERLGVDSDRCVSLFNIEGLTPTRIEAWISALQMRPVGSLEQDDYGDLSRPNGRDPWCMLMLPRASVAEGKIIGIASASDPEEVERVQAAANNRLAHASHLYFRNAPLAQAK